MSLTKLAASTAHLLMAIGFARITWRDGFLVDLWMTYGGFAILHAFADKTAAQVAAFKDKTLDNRVAP
jgi:hypothetical protein